MKRSRQSAKRSYYKGGKAAKEIEATVCRCYPRCASEEQHRRVIESARIARAARNGAA